MVFTLNGTIDPRHPDFQYPTIEKMIEICQQWLLQTLHININIKLNMENESMELAKLQFMFLRVTGQI